MALLKVLFGLFLLPSRAALKVPALADLAWTVVEPLIAFPFFLIGVMQFIGIWLNIKGYEMNWQLRAIAAALGSALWIWLIVKTVIVDGSSIGLLPFLIASFASSLWLLRRALHRLPIPGAGVMAG